VHDEGCEKWYALSDCAKWRGRCDSGYDGIEDEEVGKKSCTHCFHSFHVLGSSQCSNPWPENVMGLCVRKILLKWSVGVQKVEKRGVRESFWSVGPSEKIRGTWWM